MKLFFVTQKPKTYLRPKILKIFLFFLNIISSQKMTHKIKYEKDIVRYATKSIYLYFKMIEKKVVIAILIKVSI